MQKVWLTTREAAEYTGYSVKSLTRFCRDGDLQHVRSGMRAGYRFKAEWLDRFLTRRKPPPSASRKAAERLTRQQAARSGTDPEFDALLRSRLTKQA